MIRSARAGWNAVTTAAGELPGVGREASGRDGTGKNPPPSEYIIVEDLPDALKECYLSVLVWLVHFDDGQIDERELCEMQVLMTQLRCNADVRRAVRSHLEDPQSLEAEAQIARMLELAPSEAADTTLVLRCSLLKDAIRVLRATSGGSAREQPEIRQLAGLLELDAAKVAFLEDTGVKEEAILAGDVSDSQIANAAKSMAAQATAVGVPVAAVYLSGSVTGLSAAGIASGLATLGVGGILGLSAMVTGIGVAIVAGGAAYQGLRWVLGGGSERHRVSRRELMLQEVLRIHQGAIINLGEDMSFFGERIVDLSRETERNRDAIDTLFREVTLMSRSAGALNRLGERAVSSATCRKRRPATRHDERELAEGSRAGSSRSAGPAGGPARRPANAGMPSSRPGIGVHPAVRRAFTSGRDGRAALRRSRPGASRRPRAGRRRCRGPARAFGSGDEAS